MRNWKKTMVGMSMLSLAACGGAEMDSAPVEQQEVGTTEKFLRSDRPVAGQYIVTLREDAAGDVKGLAQALVTAHGGGEVFFTYESAVRGFAVRMTEAGARALANNPQVALVEEDGEVSLNTTQSNATWGIDRTDQRSLPLSTSFTYTATGAGVHSYIIDTGMRLTHTEFTGRVGNGYDAVTNGGDASDCNGHGTHVAGTVGGTTYGIAKKTTLHPVRVLNCRGSGTWSGVIAGVDWVKANAIKPAVANMSLGGGANTTLDNAVASAISSGVTFAVAAGNDGADACNYSPARTASALTVGATSNTDTMASWSNYGKCVDIFAPGVSITSAWKNNDTATNTISGTSMAAPHVAGVAALYLQGSPGASPSQVEAALEGNATSGVVKSIGAGSPNLLLFSSY